LRLGSMDYEPSAEVKPHTLDQRLIDTLNFQQLYDTRQKLEITDQLLVPLKASKALSMDDQKHLKGLQTLISPTLKKIKDWFKKNPTGVDQRRQISQVRERLVGQLQRVKRCIEENTLVSN